MTAITLDQAEREFFEAVRFYESKEPGLGYQLRCEVEDAVKWITRNPEVPRLRAKGYRRVNLRRFPHYVAYVLRQEAVWIVAVAHAYRRPEYWKGRLSSLHPK